MSSNYQNSDEFRREDQRLVERMDARAAARSKAAAPSQPAPIDSGFAAATPRPWHRGGTFVSRSFPSYTNVWGPTPAGMSSGNMVAQHVSLADARLIVTAVNAHEDLIAALCLCIDALEEHGVHPDGVADPDCSECAALAAARQALAKANPDSGGK